MKTKKKKKKSVLKKKGKREKVIKKFIVKSNNQFVLFCCFLFLAGPKNKSSITAIKITTTAIAIQAERDPTAIGSLEGTAAGI